jgi:hypothetical protein
MTIAWVILIVLVAWLVISLWIITNLMNQNRQLQQAVENETKIVDEVERVYTYLLKLLTQTCAELERVDKNGAFSSDDEVGFVFKVIKKTVFDVKHKLDSIRDDEGVHENATEKEPDIL